MYVLGLGIIAVTVTITESPVTFVKPLKTLSAKERGRICLAGNLVLLDGGGQTEGNAGLRQVSLFNFLFWGRTSSGSSGVERLLWGPQSEWGFGLLITIILKEDPRDYQQLLGLTVYGFRVSGTNLVRFMCLGCVLRCYVIFLASIVPLAPFRAKD